MQEVSTQTDGETLMQSYRRGIIRGGSVAAQALLTLASRNMRSLERNPLSHPLRHGRNTSEADLEAMVSEFEAFATAVEALHAATSAVNNVL